MSSGAPKLSFESLGRGRVVHGVTSLALDPLVLQTLLDHIPMRATAVGRDHCYLYANRAFLDSMGFAADQVIGRHVKSVLGEVMYEAYLPVAERLFGGEALRWEGWMDYRGRGARYYEQFLLPFVKDGSNEVSAIITFGRDVTELKQREAELSAKVHQLETTEALKSAIVDHALAALVSTDAEGRIVEFNPAAEAMFGQRRADLIGRSVGDVLIPPRHRAAHDAGMKRVTAGGPARIMGRRIEMSALRADGREFPVEMVLWRTEVAGSAYYTASMFDLSARQDAAREIERQREALRQSEKLTAMGSLLAGVAHELNNPLAIVLGRAALLEEKLADDPALAADARRIREAAERCGRIVRTFLNMARSKPAHREAVAINDLVRAAADILAYTYRSHGVALELNLPDDLPAVMADGDQIGQVVLNLLVNAQQALNAVEGERRVRVASGIEPRRENREPRVWLRVADSGPGVPEALRERIFEPFFTTKAEGLGTGLGLAVSRSIVREHGGDLQLEAGASSASFRLSLPVSGQAVASDSVPVPLDLPTPKQARVLVVDDEPEIADLVRELLEGADHEVVTAESGAVALVMLAEARFDAIVSDLHMPDVDGATLWREVRARDAALARRMLFVTGDTLSPSVRQFLDDARCPSLAKPFTKADLLAQVAALLARA
ncbi:MAG TPA: PAS domain S-box protein [Burkholderiaceae bacterium]|nr:PAS domain S-box protein [Burkholderiaceae bacterium]